MNSIPLLLRIGLPTTLLTLVMALTGYAWQHVGGVVNVLRGDHTVAVVLALVVVANLSLVMIGFTDLRREIRASCTEPFKAKPSANSSRLVYSFILLNLVAASTLLTIMCTGLVAIGFIR